MTANIWFPEEFDTLRGRVLRFMPLVLLAVALMLSACAKPDARAQATGINDPWEQSNRENHKINVALDKAVIRPAAEGYGHIVPGPVRAGVTNFAENLAQPSYVLNDLLQANFKHAAQNTLRFAFNTIFGIGGIFDPADAIGLHAARNDFGKTLYVWGAREGAYVELPIIGPGTERDLFGKLVDTVADPLRLALPKDQRWVPLTASVFSKLGNRYKYVGTVDSVLYDSADSYAQTRLLYMENRHYEIGDKSPGSTYNPYEDPNNATVK